MPNTTYAERVLSSVKDAVDNIGETLALTSVVSTPAKQSGDELYLSSDQDWVRLPSLRKAGDGIDQTGNFNPHSQVSVPVVAGKTSRWAVSTTNDQERMESLQGMLRQDAVASISTDIEVNVYQEMVKMAGVTVAKTGSPTSAKDLNAAFTALQMRGVPMNDLVAAIPPEIYGEMSWDVGGRQTMGSQVTRAFRENYLGRAGGFETIQLPYSEVIPAATATGVTVSGANQRHPIAPKETTGANKDNRIGTLTVSDGSAVKVGDRFTIAGVNYVHAATKADSGNPATFTVVAVNGNDLSITPAIICDDGSSPTQLERDYKNVSATPANNAAITFVNTANAQPILFFRKSQVRLKDGRISLTKVSGNSARMMIPKVNLTITYHDAGGMDDLSTKHSMETKYGANVLDPNQVGVILFNQT